MSPALKSILMFVRQRWPHVRLYREEKAILESLAQDGETVVAAGKKLGKDYTAGLACLVFFLCPQLFFPRKYVEQVEKWRKPGQPDWRVHTRRIITTSVKAEHLDVLWGEIGRFLDSSVVPLAASKGGPLIANSMEIRLKDEFAVVPEPINYLKGMVAKEGESMAGHHCAYGLFVADEASSLRDESYRQAKGWARKVLLIGNTNDCRNYFRDAIEAGNVA